MRMIISNMNSREPHILRWDYQSKLMSSDLNYQPRLNSDPNRITRSG
ncbi:hypothetical protein F383_24139 [Gossypium arboreum]|uniref:Uncharacterized protein n=1 Tax=Gossypium arboreum TaxID=29729 RepID=A0A0B0MRX9_GOSAR|nr:hypothetical protein F383_24139 [Gossypium arboreum]